MRKEISPQIPQKYKELLENTMKNYANILDNQEEMDNFLEKIEPSKAVP